MNVSAPILATFTGGGGATPGDQAGAPEKKSDPMTHPHTKLQQNGAGLTNGTKSSERFPD